MGTFDRYLLHVQALAAPNPEQSSVGHGGTLEERNFRASPPASSVLEPLRLTVDHDGQEA